MHLGETSCRHCGDIVETEVAKFFLQETRFEKFNLKSSYELK
jgi:hypothetical protein